MPSGFSFTAQMQLTSPNLKSFAASVQSQLNNISGTIDVKFPGVAGINSQIQALQNSLKSTSQINPVAGISKTVKTVTKDLKDATTAASQFGELVGSSIRKFTAFSLAAGSVLTLVSAIQNGVKEALEFQREMIRLEQVGGNLSNTVGGIATEIGRLSTTFGTSSSELSKVAVTLRQAGLSAEDTKLSLDALAKSTLAPTFSNITNTVEGAVAVIQQFGVQAKDLTGILGSVNAVSAAFAVESDDIVHAVRRSGGAFKAAGGNLNELISLFTSVRQTTRESAETIASGFNTIFARAQRSDTVEKLKELGINLRFSAKEAELFGKTEGDFVGPYEAVRRLNTALKNVPPASAQYAAIVEELGGFRQVSKVIPLIQQFDKAEQALGVSLGGTNSLTQSSIIAQKGLLQQASQLKEQFLDLFRVLGGSKEFQAFAELLLEVGKAGVFLAKALAPLAPLLGIFAAVKAGSVLRNVTQTGFGQGLLKGLKKNTPTGAAGLAKGGPVQGFGDKDETPILATPGEFMVKKSSARSIGYDALHRMNNTGKIPGYAEGGMIGHYDIGTRGHGFESIEDLRKQEELDNLRKARKSVGVTDKTKGKPLNRIIIKPPNNKIAVLVTDNNTDSNKDETPVLPVSNLGSTAKIRFDKDKINLVNNGILDSTQADSITSIGVPIIVRSPQVSSKKSFKEIVGNSVLGTLNMLSSRFSAPTIGIKLSPTDSKNILEKTITDGALGKIFESFLHVVSLKTGGSSKNISSNNQTFDFDPVTANGLGSLFGKDVIGKIGDVKLNDNATTRASVVSKAVRRFGLSSNISLSNLSLKRRGLSTGKEPVEVTGLDYYRSKYKNPGKKFATGGLVPGRGTKDDFPAHLQRGEFVMRQRAVDLIGSANLDQMNHSPEKFATGGLFDDEGIGGFHIVYLKHPDDKTKKSFPISFASRSQQTFTVKDAKGKDVAIPLEDAQAFAAGEIDHTKYGLTSNLTGSVTKKQQSLAKRKEGLNNGVLSVPFSNDSLGVIGVASLVRHGLINKINPVPSELKKSDIGKLFKEKGIEKLDTKYSTYGVSDQATKDFRDEIASPVTNTIANTFQSKFGGDPSQYKLSASELGTVEGYLYEKYIRSISKTKFENKGGKDLTFDYPHGLGDDDNFSKVVIPHPVTAKYIDAKYNADSNKLGEDLARKYFNQIGFAKTKASLEAQGFAEGGPSKEGANALLMRGEYVMGADSARRIGYDKLNKWNKGPEKYASGGKIIADRVHSILEDVGVKIPQSTKDKVSSVTVDPKIDSGKYFPHNRSIILKNQYDYQTTAHEFAHAYDHDKQEHFNSELPGTFEHGVAEKALKYLTPHIHTQESIDSYKKQGVDLHTDRPEAFAYAAQHYANFRGAIADAKSRRTKSSLSLVHPELRSLYRTKGVKSIFRDFKYVFGSPIKKFAKGGIFSGMMGRLAGKAAKKTKSILDSVKDTHSYKLATETEASYLPGGTTALASGLAVELAAKYGRKKLGYAGGGIFSEGIKAVDKKSILDKLKELNINISPDVVKAIGIGDVGAQHPSLSGAPGVFDPLSQNVVLQNPHDIGPIAHNLATAHDFAVSSDPEKYSSQIHGTPENIIAKLSQEHLDPAPLPIAYAKAVQRYAAYKQSQSNVTKGLPSGINTEKENFYQQPNIQGLFKHIESSLGVSQPDIPELNFSDPEPVTPKKAIPKVPIPTPTFSKGSGVKPFGIDLVTDKLRELNTDIPVSGVSKIGRGDPGKVYGKKYKGFAGGFSKADKSVVVKDETNLPIAAHELAHAHDYNVGGSDFSSNIQGSIHNKVAQQAIQHLNPEIYSKQDRKSYSKLGINLDTNNPEAYAQTAQHHTVFHQAQANITAGKPSGLAPQQEEFYQSKPIQGLFSSFRESIGTKPKVVPPTPYVPKFKPAPLTSSANAPDKVNLDAITGQTSSGVRRSIGTVQDRDVIQTRKNLITKTAEEEKPKAQKKDTCCDKIVRKLDDVIAAIKVGGTGGGGGGSKKKKKATSPTLPEPEESPKIPEKPTLGSRISQFGPTAAIIASQFAPQLIDSAFGTPETHKKGDTVLGFNRASAGAGLGGAISGAGLGASTGAIIGPIGAAFGAVAGAAYGLLSSFKDAENKIKEIRIDKELDDLGKTIERVVSEEGKLSNSGIASIRGGFSAINQGARESSDPNTFLSEKVNVSQIQGVLTKVITGLDLTGKETSAERQQKIQQAGGGLGGEATNILAKLPENANKTFNELFKQFDELAIKVGLENQRAKTLETFDNTVQVQTKNFDRLGQAITDAVTNLDNLDTALVTTASAFEGSHQLQATSRFSTGAAGIGTSNVKAFNDSVDLVTSSLNNVGLDISRDFGSALKDTNVALKNLPSILGRLASEGTLSPDNLESRFRSATEKVAPDVSKGVRENVAGAFGTIPLEDINKNLKNNPQKIIDEITSKLASTTQALDPAVKALESAINSFAGNLNKYQDLSTRAEEAQHKAVDAQVELASEQHRTSARRAGFKDVELPVGLSQIPYNVRQQNLAGVSGQNAFSPQILAAKLSGVNETIQTKTSELNTAKDKTRITQLQNELSNLGSTSNKLRGALEHLADSAARNAAINERLAKINEEEAGRLSIAEEYAAASPQDRQKLNATALAANRVSATGNLEEFPPELRSAILEFSHKVDNIPTQALHGQTGSEFRQRILQNNIIPSLSGPAVPLNLRSERNGLENERIANLNVAAQAQTELAKSLTSLKDSFFTQLQSNQKQFLNNLEKNLLESEKSKLDQQKITPQLELGKIDQQKGAFGKLQEFGLTRGNVGDAAKLVNNADVKNLSSGLKKQESLQNIDFSKIGKVINDQDTNLNIKSRFTPGLNAQSPARESFELQNDEKSDRLRQKIRDITQNVTGSTLNLGETNEKIVKPALQKFTELKPVDRTPTNLSGIITDLLKQTVNPLIESTKKENEEKSFKIQGESGLDDFQINAIAGRLEDFTGHITALGTDFSTLSDREKSATIQIEKLTESIGTLNSKILGLSEQPTGTNSVLRGSESTTPNTDSFIKSIGGSFPFTGKAKGGRIGQNDKMLSGPDGTDKYPVLIGDGETVVNRKASEKHRNLLAKMNSGKPIGMAAGGLVRRRPEDEEEDYYDYGSDLESTLKQVQPLTLTYADRQTNIADTKGFLEARNTGSSVDEQTGARTTGSILASQSERINKLIGQQTQETQAADTSGLVAATPKKFNVDEFKKASAARNAQIIANARNLPVKQSEIKDQGPTNFPALSAVANKFRLKGNQEDAERFDKLARGEAIEPKTTQPLLNVPPSQPGGFVPQGDASALVPGSGASIDPNKILSKRRKNQITGVLSATQGRDQKSFTIPELRNAANIKSLLEKTGAGSSEHGQAFGGSSISAALEEENRRRDLSGQKMVTPNQRIPGGISRKDRQQRLQAENDLNTSSPLISVEEKDISKLNKQFVGPPLPPKAKPKKPRSATISDLNRQTAASFGFDDGRNTRRFTINQLNKQAYQAYGFAEGGIVTSPEGHNGYSVPGFGTGDHVHALLTPGERVVPVLQSREQGDVIDHIIKGGKATKRLAEGGIVGRGSAGNVGSGGNAAIGSGDWTKAAESIEKSSNNMVTAAQSFNQLVAPMNSFTQSVGQMISPLTQFNAASTNLGVGLTSFVGQIPALVEGLKSLANIPSTITISGSINPVPINVNITQEISDAIKQQIMNQVIAQLKGQFKSGDVL